MPFQDMTDRELMIKLYARVDNLCEDMAELKEQIKSRPCPSDMCKSHHDDIQRLKYRNEIVVWAFGAAITVISTVVGIIAMVVM